METIQEIMKVVFIIALASAALSYIVVLSSKVLRNSLEKNTEYFTKIEAARSLLTEKQFKAFETIVNEGITNIILVGNIRTGKTYLKNYLTDYYRKDIVVYETHDLNELGDINRLYTWVNNHGFKIFYL